MPNDDDPESFVGALRLELSFEDGFTHGRADFVRRDARRPAPTGPGSACATLVDMVAGFLPTGPVNPTVDLRVSLVASLPSAGTMFLVCRPAKIGRRLFVGETLLHTGDVDQPFACSTTTFMNQPMEQGPHTTGGPEHVAIGAAVV